MNRFVLYALVALGGYIFSAIGLFLLIDILGFTKITGFVFVLPAIVLSQYILNRFYTFRVR